jgi:hypothetical protein
MNVCYSCGKNLTGEEKHAPHYEPLIRGHYWCPECWERIFGNDHVDYACGRFTKCCLDSCQWKEELK